MKVRTFFCNLKQGLQYVFQSDNSCFTDLDHLQSESLYFSTFTRKRPTIANEKGPEPAGPPELLTSAYGN